MLRRFLAVAGLTALVVAQPILDLFGNEPAATFGVHRIEGRSILLFAVLLVVVPPLVLWSVGEAVRRVDESIGDRLHLATIAVLGVFFGVLLARELSDAGALNLLIGAAVGIGAATAYRRFEGARSWIQILAAANLLFLFLFAFASPAADWMASGSAGAVALEPVRLTPDDEAEGGDGPEFDEPSVIMLVFDELPTESLLTADGQIDPVRFPNLAGFADDATWYRRFSTVNPFTQGAVPALLDGRNPYGDATWQDHPDNLFSLLAGSHQLVVSEVLTRMCGFEACLGDPQPPSPPGLDESGRDGTPTTTTTPRPDQPRVDTGPRWGDLLSTTWDTWIERVRPAPGEPAETFDDFTEDLTPAAPETPPSSTTTSVPSSTVPPDRVDDGLTEEERRYERFFATQVNRQPGRHQLFLDALQPTDDPVFGYLHLILPHQPWTLREDGTPYAFPAGRTDYADDSGHEWPVRVFRQRHLLQAEYADRLLGAVLARLQEIDLYDESVIVVVSDHGASFRAGQSSRSLTDDNVASIALAPLLIKAPGQLDGAIDDQNVNITDVTPTIARMLGLELPWEADGHPVGSPEIAARGTAKYIYDYTDAFDYTFLGEREFDGDEAFARILEGRFDPVTAEDDRIDALYVGLPGAELLGADPADHFGPADGRAVVAELDRLRDPGTALWFAEVAGIAPGAPDDATVLVAVDDRIVGVSPLYRRGDTADNFVVLLPADALAEQGNEIRVAVRTADGTITERTPE